ncbi:hypothetical protein CMV_018915 [Castanea mollissima]|uniref:Legume lectin domain-containing protein n=1 Tax=Castanea mollissima TaxID=60419 RepID=A0A8J4VNA0_9ROSI|nr:hypothetical protein CMV_018915 [Castanea mollissima]
MAAKLIFLFLVFLLFQYRVKPDLDNVGPLLTQLTDGFNAERKNMSLEGDAVIDNNGILQLTNESVQVVSHAFYKYPIQFKNSSNGKVMSFSTTFAFALINEHGKLGGHGFAFTISPSLDLFNTKKDGNISGHIFKVEFTVNHKKCGDIVDNHVRVGPKSILSNKSVPVDQSKRKDFINLKSDQVIQAWVEYDARIHQVIVKVVPQFPRPRSEIFSYYEDLSPIFKESMFVGFSGSTGLPSSSSHYVLGWSFNINGVAKNLNLDKLPKLPTVNGSKKNHTSLIVGVSVGALVVIFWIVLIFYNVRKLKKVGVVEAWELDIGPHRFSYEELKKATKGFGDKELLGFGGFEVVCGRRPIDPKALPEELMLVDRVREKWRLGAILEVVDSRLGVEFDEVEATLVLKLGLMCSNDAPESRPTMRHVVRCLETKLVLEEEEIVMANSNEDGGKYEFEDFEQSYPTTSASVGDDGDIADVFSIFNGHDGG